MTDPTSEETISFSFATSNEAITEAISIVQAWISRCDAAAETEAHGRPWVDGTTGRVIGTVHNFDKAIQLMNPDEAAAVGTILATLTGLRPLRTEWSTANALVDPDDCIVSYERALDRTTDYPQIHTALLSRQIYASQWCAADTGKEGDHNVA